MGGREAGAMAQPLKALASLPEDPSLGLCMNLRQRPVTQVPP